MRGGPFMSSLRPRRRVLLLALVLDAVVGEPPAMLHPVVWMGRAIDDLGRRAPVCPVGQLAHGGFQVLVVGGGAALAAAALGRATRRLPEPAALVAEALLLKTLLSVRALIVAARTVGRALDDGDVALARAEVRALVSRETTELTLPLLASAAVESVAENAVDSVVAPLLYYALAGLPGAAFYRAVNTLDAMVGYRGRFEYLGKIPARTDDLLNLVPARVGAVLLAGAAGLTGGLVGGALGLLRSDRGLTASPNAGWPMSAMAGALGVQLTKPGAYCLGASLPEPDADAIDRAVSMLVATTLLCVPVATVVAGWTRTRPGARTWA